MPAPLQTLEAAARALESCPAGPSQAEVVVAGWIDDAGANVLTASDVDSVLAQPSKIVALLSKEISKLSGMEAAETAEATPVEEAKNG